MRAATAKRAKLLSDYRIKRAAWLRGRQCARCGTRAGLTLQHAAGRRGRRLLDSRFWLAMCWDCHRWADDECPVEAARQGFRLPRTVPEDRLVEVAATFPWYEL